MLQHFGLSRLSSRASAIALSAALALGAFAVVRGTWAVGGSDSSCYGLMADAFAHGELQPALPLAMRAPWPDAARTFAPGGFIPSPVRADAASPICAPGFSLLLTPFRWLGGVDAIFLFTPIAGALLVWFTFLVARHLAGDGAGVLAAIVAATTPIVLFQVVQPMNDITTVALWMGVASAACRKAPSRWWLMGALTGLALLVRPNLAPVAGFVGLWVIFESKSVRATAAFSLAAAPGVAVAAAFNSVLYGSPLRVGYGDPGDLFSTSYVATNLLHFGRSAFATLTPFPLLAVAAPFVLPREKRSGVWLLIGIVFTTVGIYLLYRPFDEWWYLRFLLPAVAATIALASASLAVLVRRPVAIALVAAALGIFGIYVAVQRQALDLQRLEARFRDTGHAVRDRLPSNALFFTVWQSGTVRYHAQREAVLWDSLEPAALDSAVAWVQDEGFEPYLLIERWEEPAFRARFAGHASIGALDWPPRMEIDRQVRIYAPADRAAYLAGQSIPTEHVFAR
jgi:Dolichyl-phosphate-mannose-protein mannosyltransferase